MITSGVAGGRGTRCSALLALQLPGQLGRAGLRRSNAAAVCVHSDT